MLQPVTDVCHVSEVPVWCRPARPLLQNLQVFSVHVWFAFNQGLLARGCAVRCAMLSAVLASFLAAQPAVTPTGYGVEVLLVFFFGFMCRCFHASACTVHSTSIPAACLACTANQSSTVLQYTDRTAARAVQLWAICTASQWLCVRAASGLGLWLQYQPVCGGFC